MMNRDQLLKDYARIIDEHREEIKGLYAELEYYRGLAEQLGAGKAVSERNKALKESEEIEQILGKALGYPWYKDDLKNFPTATEADGVCVGVETAWSLAMIAADKIKMLDIREQDKQKIINEQREEITKLKESVEYYSDMMYHYME